jgi:hypothetical protein
LAGALAGILLELGTDMALRAAGIFPELGKPMSNALFVLATAYRTVFGIAGSYLTARLAPSRPMLHAMILGVLGLAATLAGVITTWDKGPEFGPKWYPILLVFLCLPQSWYGAKLAEKRAAA